jgi:hypothetical protein
VLPLQEITHNQSRSFVDDVDSVSVFPDVGTIWAPSIRPLVRI